MGPGLLTQRTEGPVNLPITSLDVTFDLEYNVLCHKRATDEVVALLT